MTLPPDSLYLRQEVSLRQLPPVEDRWLFIGIDMAPIETLETGVTMIDRDRKLLRMDKLDRDDEILGFIRNLGQKDKLIIALDVPKSLGIQGKWRQQKVKMHPFSVSPTKRTEGAEGEKIHHDRFAERALAFYQTLKDEGYFIFNFFTGHARMGYDLNVPFKSRTPQGCRAQQAAIREYLKLQNMPNNLAPSSVLDAMVGAYAAWSVWVGRDKVDFQFYLDDAERLYLNPLQRTPDPKPRRTKRMYRLKRIVPPRGRSRDRDRSSNK